jgi:SOS-response transcriptional repressor LexA
MKQLTNAQNTLLQAIERLKRAMGMSPTVQELAVELGVKAPSVFEGLKRLEDKGYIRRQARKARSIEILRAQTPDKTNLTAVPVLGMVAAGAPILAQENRMGQVMVPNSVALVSSTKKDLLFSLDKELFAQRKIILRFLKDTYPEFDITDRDINIAPPKPPK